MAITGTPPGTAYVVGTFDTKRFSERLDAEWWPALRTRYADAKGMSPADQARIGDDHVAKLEAGVGLDDGERLPGVGRGAGRGRAHRLLDDAVEVQHRHLAFPVQERLAELRRRLALPALRLVLDLEDRRVEGDVERQRRLGEGGQAPHEDHAEQDGDEAERGGYRRDAVEAEALLAGVAGGKAGAYEGEPFLRVHSYCSR